jgi:hypothetical protein
VYVLQVQTGQYCTGQHSTARVSEEESTRIDGPPDEQYQD